MKRFILLILSVFVLGCGSESKKIKPKPKPRSKEKIERIRQKKLKVAIRKNVEAMQQAFQKGDLDKFVTYVDPEIIKTVGGVEKLKKLIEPSLELLKAIEKTEYGQISDVVKGKDGLVAFVPMETTIRNEDEQVLRKSYRIACSTDGGTTWTFMEGQGKKEQEKVFKAKYPVLTKRFPFPDCGER